MTTLSRRLMVLGARRTRLPSPARIVRLLSSIRFAAAVVAWLVAVCLAGVLIPQVTPAARADPASMARWLAGREATFGPATNTLYRLGVFNVFHSAWLAAGLALLAVSVILCTARRFGPIWKNVRHPVKAVPEAYLDHAHHRAAGAGRFDPGHVERLLRSRHYTVERWTADDAEWFFAERYQWAQLGTFVMHAAIVLLIVAALITYFTGFTARLFVANGSSEPMFALGHEPALDVSVANATSQADAHGNPVNFTADLSIAADGSLAKTCTVTATRPCSYAGYRFRQAFSYPYGADIEVRDLSSGRVIYRDNIPLTSSTETPHLVVTDLAGRSLLDQTLVFTGSVAGVSGTAVTVPGISQPLWIGMPATSGAPQLVVFQAGDAPGAIRLTLALHDQQTAAGFHFTFMDLAQSPAASAASLPMAAGTPGSPVPALTMMNATRATPLLSMTGVGPDALTLKPGDTATSGGYQYTFVGPKTFIGIEVHKDYGEPLIWLGSAMLVIGLCLTLWVPRRRLWARVSADGIRVAAAAPRMTNVENELESLVSEAMTPR